MRTGWRLLERPRAPTIISATLKGFSGVVAGTSDLAVTGHPAPGLVSISIIPGAQGVASVSETGQYIAIGTFSGSGPTTRDLTNVVAWKSSDVKVATIGASGLATGVSDGTTTITAIGTGANGAIITATSSFTEGAGPGPVNLPTLTVYKVGNNAATGTVTATAPGTTTPLVINCGSGADCVGNFVLGSTVTLTETPGLGSTFGGWSANCTPIPSCNPYAPQCMITTSNNDTVGAIFN